MVINNFDIPGMAIPELEGDPPRSAGRNRPFAAPCTPQAMKTDRLQAGQVFEAVGLIEQTQTASSQGFVKPGKSASSLFGKALRRPIGP